MTESVEARNFDPLGGDAPLIVYFDIKSPYAFVAKDPIYLLADEFDIDVDWRPLTLDIPSYLGSAKLDKKGKVASSNRTKEQWGGVRYAYMDARRYAAAWGYGLRGTEKIWDTRLIHIAFDWVKRSDPGGRREVRAFLDAVYPRFWMRDIDVEDLSVVSAELERAGVSAEGFAAWADGDGGQIHDAQQAAIFEQGIYGVPGLVYEREYYFGREHLNHLRALLQGREAGTADVAYSLPAPEVLEKLEAGKHDVFLAMRRAASQGRLKITAGVNGDCAQTHLALRTIEELQRDFPNRLDIEFGESRPSKSSSLLFGDVSANESPQDIQAIEDRGAAHRTHRSRYQMGDAKRYVTWRDVSLLPSDHNRFAQITINLALKDTLLTNGVSESFGFFFLDSDDQVHPFNGRQHLFLLRWVLEST